MPFLYSVRGDLKMSHVLPSVAHTDPSHASFSLIFNNNPMKLFSSLDEKTEAQITCHLVRVEVGLRHRSFK